MAYTLKVCDIICSTTCRDPHKLTKMLTLKSICFQKGVTFSRTPKIYNPFDGSEGAEGEDRTRASNSQGAPQ